MRPAEGNTKNLGTGICMFSYTECKGIPLYARNIALHACNTPVYASYALPPPTLKTSVTVV